MHTNKTIFITGATSGFGLATAEIFAQNGYNLILNGRRTEKLQTIAANLEQTYQVKVLQLPFDVRDEKAVYENINGIPEDFLPVDILVNNAGLAAGRDYFEEADINDWNVMVDTNIKGAMYVAQAVTRLMVQTHNNNACKGHVINIGSIAGKNVYERGNIYNASKAALDAMSRAMRVDLLRHRIKVTAIHPGAVLTEFSLVRFKGDTEKADSVYKGIQPLTAEDIAGIVYYCATLPVNVCINDLVVTPIQQADGVYSFREE